MGFPSSVSPTVRLERAFDTLLGLAGLVKQRTVRMNSDSAAGPIDGAAVINYLRDLVQAKARMAEVASTPGLTAYAQEQYNDPARNLTAEYSAMIAAIDSTISWIGANFPKDGSGYLLYEQVAGSGAVTYRQFSTAALAGFRTVLSALAATID